MSEGVHAHVEVRDVDAHGLQVNTIMLSSSVTILLILRHSDIFFFIFVHLCQQLITLIY